MTGWEKVIAVTVLLVVALVAFNIALWRRMRIALAQRPAWTTADFDSALHAAGCAPAVPPVVRTVLAPHYLTGAVPSPEDDLHSLGIGDDEVEEIVSEAFMLLALPVPIAGQPERVPSLATVGDLARYLSIRYAALAAPTAPPSPRI